MIGYLARLIVADNSGVRLVQCINLLFKNTKSIARIGDVIVVVTKRLFTWSRMKKGIVTRGLIVRSCLDFIRGGGIWVKFNQNAVILVNKKLAPIAKRLKGPFIKEICIKYNLLGTVTRFLV